eukprot:TRINITY_DN7532_c0_g1_i1.p1 TRINITY_DN7532_c0_g1~~TRINITY_DN7532_c0_g1_i1.p1  ORF type:complete len:569 (-),score=115.83 TRINITY_DN7532_c0_g1_i1:25-1731(-)
MLPPPPAPPAPPAPPTETVKYADELDDARLGDFVQGLASTAAQRDDRPLEAFVQGPVGTTLMPSQTRDVVQLDGIMKAPPSRLAVVQEETETDDLLLQAILDDALRPPRRHAEGAAAAAAATAAGLGIPSANQQDMHDDAALAFILQNTPVNRRSRAAEPTGTSGALARLLHNLEKSPDATARHDDATLQRVLSGGLLSGRRSSGVSTARDDDAALRQALEQLAPENSIEKDDNALAKALGTPTPVRKLPRSVLLSMVADVTDMMHKSMPRAKVFAGGRGRGERLDQLCQPVGLAVARDGSVFIADCGNCRVLKVSGTAEGVVVAGGRDHGYNWFDPIDVAYSEAGDGQDTLLVTASGGLHLFSAKAPDGTLVADGCLPSGLVLESAGSLLFADAYDHCVTRCQWRQGTALRELVVGMSADGESSMSGEDLKRLHRPFGIDLDRTQGALIIADSGNHRVIRFQPGCEEGEVIAGGNGRGGRLDQLSYPRNVLVEKSGSILVADTFNHRIVRWRRGAKAGEVVFGTGQGSRLEQLNRPAALAMAGEKLLIADSGNHRILEVLLSSPLLQ